MYCTGMMWCWACQAWASSWMRSSPAGVSVPLFKKMVNEGMGPGRATVKGRPPRPDLSVMKMFVRSRLDPNRATAADFCIAVSAATVIPATEAVGVSEEPVAANDERDGAAKPMTRCNGDDGRRI